MRLAAVWVGLSLGTALRLGAQGYSVVPTELSSLPVGCTLPVSVGATLRAGKTRVGTSVVAKTTQRVPIGRGEHLDRGATVLGTVVVSAAGDGSAGHPSVLGVRFGEVRFRGARGVALQVPVAIDAVAVAGVLALSDTEAPANGSTDRGNPSPASWTTRQVGGDEVARSGWIGEVVNSSMQTVGSADYYGVYSLPAGDGAVGAGFPHAMGVFSVGATGVYGYGPGISLTNGGRVITMTSQGRKLELRGGDNLLLRVVDFPPP